MSVVIYGMPISGNVIPAVLLAMDSKCGHMEMMNIMTGEHKTPEKLAINPWHQMPAMKDGDLCLAEGNAILRYIGNKYATKTYADLSIEQKALVDWALDWCGTNFYKQYMQIWYPTVGFGAPPDDQAAANAAATENLEKFAAKFLSSSKFIAGDVVSIADYKCAIQFWYCDFPVIKAKTGFEVPPRIKQYVADFMEVCQSQEFLEGAKGFMASKSE